MSTDPQQLDSATLVCSAGAATTKRARLRSPTSRFTGRYFQAPSALGHLRATLIQKVGHPVLSRDVAFKNGPSIPADVDTSPVFFADVPSCIAGGRIQVGNSALLIPLARISLKERVSLLGDMYPVLVANARVLPGYSCARAEEPDSHIFVPPA